MFQFVSDRLKVEAEDLGDRIQTKLFIQFTVKENGELEDIKVIKGLSEKVDNKVVKIFEEMPNWEPAYLCGKPTRLRCIYPINIELE
jgi:hypothetical protein